MIKWCIDLEAGSTPGEHYVTKTSHPLTDSAAAKHVYSDCRPESFMNDIDNIEEQYVSHESKQILVDSTIVDQRLAVHDRYYTHDNDTFKDVCIAVKVDKALWPVYYSWVHEEFMRGEFFLQRNVEGEYIYPESIGFQDPFQKGVRYKKLPDNVSFPLPKGPLWERKLNSMRNNKGVRDIEEQNRKESSYSLHSAYVQSVYDTMKHRECESQSTILAGTISVPVQSAFGNS